MTKKNENWVDNEAQFLLCKCACHENPWGIADTNALWSFSIQKGLKMFRRPHKLFKIILLIVITVYVISTFLDLKLTSKPPINPTEILSLVENPLEILNIDVYPRVQSYKMKDWHDYKFIAYEASRVGLGENGTKVILTNPMDIAKNDEVFAVEGLSGHVSDLISVNRSVPDTRHFLWVNFDFQCWKFFGI